MIPAVELHGVSRVFGAKESAVVAVDNLTLTAAPGVRLGLLGPNGSGKSTTIKIVLGLLAPSEGFCRVFGYPAGSIEARQRLGYIPEAPYYYRHLSARELLRFYAKLCLLPSWGRELRITKVLELVGLAAAADRRIGTYSKGMLQRVGMAQAIVHDPLLVILDEPNAGLDAEGIERLHTLLARMEEDGRTVLLTSHVHSQIEAWCDRVAVLDRGRLVFSGPPSELTGVCRRAAIVRDMLTREDRADLDAWMISRGLHWQPFVAGEIPQETPLRSGVSKAVV